MAQRMLIDATHPEETRVAVVSGNRLDDLDYETSTKKQLKGNIYLAKVVRVEPSLQACFVDYGGNRHGFLAFSEIHPDYYRIPIADREALLAEQAAAAAEEEAEAESAEPAERGATGGEPPGEPLGERPFDEGAAQPPPAEPEFGGEEPQAAPSAPHYKSALIADQLEARAAETGEAAPEPPGYEPPEPDASEPDASAPEASAPEAAELGIPPIETAGPAAAAGPESAGEAPARRPATPVETVGGDAVDEVRRRRPRPVRNYKIQEVIKRRQIMLVQVVKEERGNKGAALTTYLSLAGRYCVLMPNTTRGGGVSRKITNALDRRRLKTLLEDLNLPPGMGVIVRTAGSERSKPEVKRDCDYLLKLWDEIREVTLKSTAPCLIYEEANLIKRAIRDLYARDIDDILVEGEEGYRAAKDFMKMLMPSHAKRVQQYTDPIPLFHRFQIESQIDAMHNPVVQLRSGGYVVINPTEALVAIDVNSGRATRERFIEETALRTNLEAAEEVARQLRLRDLGGLIVIDFIDMEDNRNNHAVERRLKEALRFDRARIQVGRISPFGLLELSRQRLRPSIHETSTMPCPHCGGSGHIRSTESAALHVLRAIEEEGIKRRSREVVVHVATPVALYILNQKRGMLGEIERRYGFAVMVMDDPTLIPPNYRLERVRAAGGPEAAAPVRAESVQLPPYEEAPEEEAAAAEAGEAPGEPERMADAFAEEPGQRREFRERGREHGGEPGEGGRRGRRRRRRRGGRPGEERAPQHPRAPSDGERYRPPPAEREPAERASATPEPFAGAAAAVAEAELAAERGEPRGEQAGEPRESRPQGGRPPGEHPPGEHPPGEHPPGDGEHRRRRRRGRRGGRRRRDREGRGPEGYEAEGHGAEGHGAEGRGPGPMPGDEGGREELWPRDPSGEPPLPREEEVRVAEERAEPGQASWSPRPDLGAPRAESRRPEARRPEPQRPEPPRAEERPAAPPAAEETKPRPSRPQPSASAPANVVVVGEDTAKPAEKRGWWRRMTSGGK
jgi:ribonuclease E